MFWQEVTYIRGDNSQPVGALTDRQRLSEPCSWFCFPSFVGPVSEQQAPDSSQGKEFGSKYSSGKKSIVPGSGEGYTARLGHFRDLYWT